MFKKILSLTIALSMVFAMLAGAAVTYAADEIGGVTIAYDLAAALKTLGASYNSSVLFDEIDYELTNGFFDYFGSNAVSETGGVVSSNINYRGNNIQLGSGKYIAFEVFVPYAGNYTMEMYAGEYDNSKITAGVEVYVSEGEASTSEGYEGYYCCYKEGEKTFAVPTDPKTLITEYGSEEQSVIELKEPGYYVFTFRATDSYGSVGSFKLVGGTDTCLAAAEWDIDKTELNLEVNKTAQITHKLFASDVTEITDGSYDTDIVYDSSNEEVATVDENGLVTAVGVGDATITASITNEGGYTFTFEKDISVEEFGIAIKYDLGGIMTEKSMTYSDANITKTLSDIDYNVTNGFFDFKTSVSGDTTAHKTNMNYRGWHIQLYNNAWVSFEIFVPKTGIYTMSVEHGKHSTSTGYTLVYLQNDPNSFSSTSMGNLIGKFNCKGDDGNTFTTKFTSNVNDGTDEKNLVELIFDDPGKYVITFKASGGYSSVGTFTLTNGTGSAVINGSAEKAMSFTIGDASANVNATGYLSATAAAAENISYSSSNENVATVNESGSVTPVGPGSAVITSTFTDAVVNNTVTTAVKVAAPIEEVGEEDTVSFGVYQINGADSDITVTAPANVTVGSTAEAAVGTTVKAEAADKVDGKRFAYWRVGGSFYTAEKNLEYTLNTNASFVAVYEDEATAENSAVEFWNENGQFLDRKTVSEGLVTMPADPSLTGYDFDGWYVNDTEKFVNSNIAAALTRVVAKYTRGENDTGVSVSGSIKLYEDGSDTATQTITAPAYNTEITATAEAPDGKVFSHWTRDGEVVSYDSTYTFRAWGETEIKAVFADEAAAKVPVITLAKTKIGNASMVEYCVPEGYTKIEAGIVFNNLSDVKSTTVISFGSKAAAKSTAACGQFTATGEDYDIVARGYLIYKNNTDNKTYIIYAD